MIVVVRVRLTIDMSLPGKLRDFEGSQYSRRLAAATESRRDNQAGGQHGEGCRAVIHDKGFQSLAIPSGAWLSASCEGEMRIGNWHREKVNELK